MRGRKAEKAQQAARVRLWVARASTTVLPWTCVVLLAANRGQQGAFGVDRAGRWSSYLTQPLVVVQRSSKTAGGEREATAAVVLPPKRIYKNNGYLMVSCNYGLNQMRADICDMVTISTYLNVTRIVPELDKTSFWGDPRQEGGPNSSSKWTLRGSSLKA